MSNLSTGARVALAFVFGWILPQVSRRLALRFWLVQWARFSGRRLCRQYGHIEGHPIPLVPVGVCHRCGMVCGSDGTWMSFEDFVAAESE
jgi:hypothetical protein